MSGFTFEGQMYLARYAARAQAALLNGFIPMGYRTSRCTECGDEMTIGSPEDHVIMVDANGTQLVLIACEGYLMVPPAVVGMGDTYPNWSDWTAGDDLGDEVARCGSTLRACWMEPHIPHHHTPAGTVGRGWPDA
jgi:hypothetical protein